jgi:Transglutaminase-like superfamily
MKLFRQFAALTPRERSLLLRAVILVAVVRLALWTTPFRAVRKLLAKRPAVSAKLAAVPVKRLSWAVQAAARRIPAASCLTQALALQHLLARAGHLAELHIGVAKDAARGFQSHAWVEYRGQILLGDNGELEHYSPILALKED